MVGEPKDILLHYMESLDKRLESIDGKLDRKANKSDLDAHEAQDSQIFTELREKISGITWKVALIVGALVGAGVLSQEVLAALLQ